MSERQYIKVGLEPGHADRGHFRSSGQALRWIEEAVERRLRER